MPDAEIDASPVRDAPAGGAGRLAWLDYAKAFAIVLVVFGHASRSVERSDGLTWSEGLRLADQLIYSFHIPLFFILSGYAASLVAGRGWQAQVRGLVWGVAVPYLVWTVVWVGLKMAFPGSVNEPAAWGDLLTALWLPVEHMWFLQHLLIARLYWMAAERAGALSAGSAAGSLLIAVLFAVAVWTSTFETEPRVVTSMISNVAFVGVGAIWVPALVQMPRRARLSVGAVLAFAGWLFLALQLGPDDLGLTSFAAALLASFAVLVAVWYLPSPASIGARALAFLGEASLAIYVAHSIVIAMVRALLQAAGALDEATVVVAGTVLGLLVPAVLYWCVLALSLRAGWPLARIVGFGTATRSHYFDTARPALARAAPAAAGT